MRQSPFTDEPIKSDTTSDFIKEYFNLKSAPGQLHPKAMDLLRSIYGRSITPAPMEVDLAYFKRDAPGASSGTADPLKSDPWLVGPTRSYDRLLDTARDAYQHAVAEAVQFGIPTKPSLFPGVDKLDTAAAIDNMTDAMFSKMRDDYTTMAHAVADADSLLKLNIQRGVRPMWYVRNMKANSTPVLSDHKIVLDLMLKGGNQLLKTTEGNTAVKMIDEGQGDPMGTNIGWPMMISEFKGIDAKYWMSEFFERAGPVPDGLNTTPAKILSWAQTLGGIVASSGFKAGLLPPFCTALTRRFKTSAKLSPRFASGPNPSLEDALLGIPDQRVAFMFSYVHNLLSSPYMPSIKGWRYMVEGMYHDEVGRKRYAQKLISSKGMLLENDAGGFDTNISLQHHAFLAEMFTKLQGFPYSSNTGIMLLMGMRTNKLLLPSPFSTKNGAEGLVISSPTGLQSGAKATGEVGSYMTKWMNLVAYRRLGWLSDAQIVQHMAGSPLPDGRLQLISGDDNTHIVYSAAETRALSAALTKVYSEFGVKADLELSDRFLMRHVHNAADKPVVGRLYQQRISHENPPDSPIIYALGSLVANENNGTYTLPALREARVRAGFAAATPTPAGAAMRSKELWTAIGEANRRSAWPSDSIQQVCRICTGQASNQAEPQYNALLKAATVLQSGTANAMEQMLDDLLRNVHSPNAAAQLDALMASSKAANAYINAALARGRELYLKQINLLGLTS